MTLYGRFLNPSELLLRGGPGLRSWWEESRVRVPGYQHTIRYKRKLWDGWYYPGGKCRQVQSPGKEEWEWKGSVGLLPRLRVLTDPRDFYLRGEVPRILFPEDVGWLREAFARKPALRDYQREALTLGLRERWGRVALATNAGKGAVIALLAQALSRKETRVLILCDEIAVFQALGEEIREWGDVEIGRVQSGTQEPPGSLVTLAMVPTLARRLQDKDGTSGTWKDWRDWVGGMGALLLDEADKATADTWRRILRTAKHSHYRLGFSGTFPTDPYGSLLMEELLGPVLLRAQNLELVERGISARPLVYLHRFDASPALWGMSFPAGTTGPARRQATYERGVVFNPERHSFVASLLRPGVPTCVVVNRVEHGRLLTAHIPGAQFLFGDDPPRTREEILTAFGRGEFSVLICTKILDRGTNRLGSAVDLIFASGEGSTRQTLQRIGRGLRRQGGKEFLYLSDVVDHGSRYFKMAGRRRVRLYQEEGFDLEVGRPPGVEEDSGAG